MDILVITSVFAAVGLFAYAALSFVFAEDRAVHRRLRDLTDYEVDQAMDARPVLKSFRERVFVPVVNATVAVAQALGPSDLLKRTDERLTLAGRPAGLDPSGFIMLRIALSAAGFAIGVLVLLLGTIGSGAGVVLTGALTVVGYAAPGLWLRNRIERRQIELRRSLPDMLDMLTISVEAGLGFDAALSKYVKNSSGALASEFGRALQEVQAGVSRRDALRRIMDRTKVSELSSFLSAMIQAEMLGTSVAQVLRSQSTEIRLRRRQHAEEEAQKLPVKQIFPVILCILPATMLVVLGPAVVMLAQLFGGE